MSITLRILWLLLISSSLFAQQKHTISGYVRDASSGEELIGATIAVKELSGTGAVTNIYGFYSLTLPAGKYHLITNYLGYQDMVKEIVLDKNISFNFELQPESTQLEVVVVTAEREERNVTDVKMSRENLSIETIKSMPALFGEVDVIKSVQMLPGVLTAGEGTTGLFVRGGAADQNLILLDEATVYNASHLLGFFSVFNPDAVKNVELYKGGIPAKYGGRLSSIIDIQMREGNNKSYQASGGIGTISSRLTLEGPIVKDKASFLLSGRRTYADLFLYFAADETLRNNQLYFYDFNAKANYKINDKNRIYLSGYFGRDKLGLGDLIGFDWGNITTTMRWNHLFSEKLFMNTTLLYSNFDYGFLFDFPGQSFTWTSRLEEQSIKTDFDYFLNPNNTLNFGVNLIRHTFDPATVNSNDNIIEGFELERLFAYEGGIYVSNEQKFGDKISMQYGLRLSAFANTGPGTEYIYQNENTPRESEIIDSVRYEGFQLRNMRLGLEPRFGVRYMLGTNNSLKFSYNRMYQYLQVATNATASFPTDRWIPANRYIKPMIGDQIAMGYFHNLQSNMYETSVELYYKWLTDVVDFKPGADLLFSEIIETAVLPGRGWAYGSEFLVKKTKGRTTGWISYTLSRAQRQIAGIAGGNPYNARYDRRHDLSVIATYELTPSLSLASNFVYSTGAAVTFPQGRYEIDGRSVPFYDDLTRNSDRLPDYHRLDFSVIWELKNRFNNKWEHNLNFSVYNLYNRRNVFSIEFTDVINGDPNWSGSPDEIQTSEPGAVRTALFGIIPSITYNFKIK